MTKQRHIRWRAACTAIALGAALACGPAALAQQAPPARAKAAAAPSASQSQAREILMRMADFVGGAKAFSVTVLDGYDAVQPSGQKLEFGDTRRIALQRPDRLRVESVGSNGARTLAAFTGKEIVVFDVANKMYASEPQPGGVDESIVHLVRDLHVRLPMALLLVSRLPAEFEARVKAIDYVEKTNIHGVPSHHLAARGDGVDFQVWVADGKQPYPVRVVLTYRDEPGQPQFRAQFSDWNFAPRLADDTLALPLPPDAKKVAFAARIARPTGTRSAAPGQGGRK
jgi:hypothetical protein